MDGQKKDRNTDTIAAIATAPGKAAIGIVRVSGPEATGIARKVFQGEKDASELKGFEAAHGWVVLGGEKIDEVVLLMMRGPRSYTREDMVEISCHGSPVVLRRVLDAVLAAGARMAKPGEFTKRAFLAGRIDLSQAEAVAALIESETEAAARSALAGLAGELSGETRELRACLLELLSEVEAGLDFAEDDLEFISREKLAGALRKVMDELGRLLLRAQSGQILCQGVRLVIAGRPNVGKSTLMNALLGQERVIVAPDPGTTRDVVEDAACIGGVVVRISDTAGIAEDADELGRKGVERSRMAIGSADLVLLVLDGSEPLTSQDRAVLDETKNCRRLVLLNKSDLPRGMDSEELGAVLGSNQFLAVSAKTGEGMPALRERIGREIWSGKVAGEDALMAGKRQMELLEGCREALAQGLSAAEQGLSGEFMAADIRKAIECLAELSGESVGDEVLELIFSRFCIGK